MAADADVRSPPEGEPADAPEAAAASAEEEERPASEAGQPRSDDDGAGTAADAPAVVATDDGVVVRLDCEADALAHLDPGEPLDADAARELAALLDGYAADRDGR